MLVVWLQRGRSSARPLPFRFECLTRGRYPDHVHGMARVTASECGLVLTHPSHCATQLKYREDRCRRGDPEAVIDEDINHVIGQLRQVAGADVSDSVGSLRCPGGESLAFGRADWPW